MQFIYDPSWQVSIGDESTEASLQTQREVRVLEAIYPRLTAIPARLFLDVLLLGNVCGSL